MAGGHGGRGRKLADYISVHTQEAGGGRVDRSKAVKPQPPPPPMFFPPARLHHHCHHHLVSTLLEMLTRSTEGSFQ